MNPMHLRHQALVTTRFFALVKMLRHPTVDIDTLADVEQRTGIIIKPVHPAATRQGLNLNARTGQLEWVGKHGVIFVFPIQGNRGCPYFVSVNAFKRDNPFITTEPGRDSLRRVPYRVAELGGPHE